MNEENLNPQEVFIYQERIKYLETRCDCLETRINKEIENCKTEVDLNWNHQRKIEELNKRIGQLIKTRHQYIYNERGIDVLEKSHELLKSLQMILNPHTDSPVIQELEAIIKEQKDHANNKKQ